MKRRTAKGTEVIAFWAIAIGLTAFVVFVLARTALMARGGEDDASNKDVEIYKAQLREVERDVERGVVAPADAEALRTEIARRLLAADAAAGKADRHTRRAPFVVTVLAGGAVGAVGVATYLYIGAPGYGDMPLSERLMNLDERAETRPAQSVIQRAYLASLEPVAPTERYATLLGELRRALEERPDDLRGLALLARNEAIVQNYPAAITAQRRILQIKGADAEAADFRDLAEFLIVAAGGYVSPEAEDALLRALARNPHDGPSRYYLGLMHEQNGRVDRTFALWQPLLEESPSGSPWVPLIREQLPFVAERAGIRYVLPEGRGPSAEEMAAAADMSPEDRAAMIQGMVEGLADRLATQGGPPQDWARLISAQAVLGNTEAAQNILQEARTVFADRADAMRLLQQTAAEVGLE